MVFLKPQSTVGYAPPPQTPYSIVSNIPGWDILQKFRDGDMSSMVGVVNIYPRFSPTHFAAQLGKEIAKKVGKDGQGCMFYLNPIMIPYTRRHVSLEHRKEHVMKPEDPTWKIVDVAVHRIFAVLYNTLQTLGIIESWGQPGLGISIQGAEGLLKSIGTMEEVPFEDLGNPPEPTFTPESWAHTGPRERINELIHRAAINPTKMTCEPKYVFVYPTGMGAIYSATNLLLEHRPGTFVVLRVVFHNTHHHLFEEAPNGFKHVRKVDKESIDNMEAWLKEEKKAGRPSENYGFILIVDDTVGGSGKIDVFALTEILVTSLTKSFSGYSNVLGGSIVLNPLSPHCTTLAAKFSSTHKNELFAADAQVLLSNSQDFLARTRILNRNAQAMASFFQRSVTDPNSPVVNVQYPA